MGMWRERAARWRDAMVSGESLKMTVLVGRFLRPLLGRLPPRRGGGGMMPGVCCTGWEGFKALE